MKNKVMAIIALAAMLSIVAFVVFMTDFEATLQDSISKVESEADKVEDKIESQYCTLNIVTSSGTITKKSAVINPKLTWEMTQNGFAPFFDGNMLYDPVAYSLLGLSLDNDGDVTDSGDIDVGDTFIFEIGKTYTYYLIEDRS